MRIVVVGFGVQGKKRLRVAGNEAVGIVDPFATEANWKDIRQVPLDLFDGAIVSTSDEPKLEILDYLARNGKHALIEKPLYAKSEADLASLQKVANETNAVLVTAYNHRFEPHFVRMRDLIISGELGRIYRCRMFYGNGTARLVRESDWRDQGAGVLGDLGSHLLDTARFWFGDLSNDFRVISASRFENCAPDHVVIGSETSNPKIELEMTLLSWRNHFTCDILAENGSAHIESLCKWGPTVFTHRKRLLPSGRPSEFCVTLTQDDPTWELEYAAFKSIIKLGCKTDMSNDKWLLNELGRLSLQAVAVDARR